MRKIDADELIKTIEKVCFSPEWARFRVDFGSNGERDYIINEIVNAPTVEERPTGEWIRDEMLNIVCSICGGIRRDNRVLYMNYCNKCGAKMKGEEE